MNRKFTTRFAVAVGTVAFAMMTGQFPIAAQSQTAPGPDPQTSRPSAPTTQTPAGSAQTPRPSGDQVTVSGCIQREADYRRSTGAGRGGAVGTGAGVANEFILANAMMSRGVGSSSSTGASSTATGTTGTNNTAYELTGPNEGQAATHVGKRVEITGTLKSTDTAPAGGATANVPGSQDLKLRELEITSIRETSGTCTPATPSTTAP
jgi:hypothetical protein